ncbi:hypothetical protein FIBSPDRAFT_835643 [Athelia psychrophila]|uniref:Uncharacterized protein n=1 Tax=Athelia psychrophila TaxID=1759441 RepID=A0A166BUD3_9AGAM|nr:hypothetical protein FIBSPDRAFT_835643 [Fibularhizoctonia sp. CBS 109695]
MKPDSAAEATSKKEKAARAAAIERKKKGQEAADKKAEAKSKEAGVKAAEIEQKKREQEAADKMKDWEEKKQTEAAAAAKHQKDKAEQKARELQAKEKQDKREAEAQLKEDAEAKASIKSSKEKRGKPKPTAAISGISNTTLIGTAANEDEDWSQLTPWEKYMRKLAKFEKERDAEERAELVKQARQQLADEAAAEGGTTQQGAGGTSDVSDDTSSISITEPNGVSSVSNISMGTAAIKKDDWSHLTPSERYEKKAAKARGEIQDDRDAKRAAKSVEVLKEVKQQMADEAKAAEEAAAQQGAGSCSALDCHGGPDPHLCGWHSGA